MKKAIYIPLILWYTNNVMKATMTKYYMANLILKALDVITECYVKQGLTQEEAWCKVIEQFGIDEGTYSELIDYVT